MKAREKWVCWELSRKEIDRVAKRVGVDPEKLTVQDYENIVIKFKEQLKKVNKQQWEIILEDTVEREVG